eukprot:904833-Alexandrium_andersonii.AAC.1
MKVSLFAPPAPGHCLPLHMSARYLKQPPSSAPRSCHQSPAHRLRACPTRARPCNFTWTAG